MVHFFLKKITLTRYKLFVPEKHTHLQALTFSQLQIILGTISPCVTTAKLEPMTGGDQMITSPAIYDGGGIGLTDRKEMGR